MTLRDRIDPELVGTLDFFLTEIGPDFMARGEAPYRRQRFKEFLDKISTGDVPFPHIERSDVEIDGPDEGQRLLLRVYRPQGLRSPRGGVYSIHGGGFTIGDIAQDDAHNAGLADALGCTVVTVEYRLAPEHPHPAPINDCHQGYRWMVAHAVSIGVDSACVAVYGHSAGGGLSAALAFKLRETGEQMPALQMLCYPMLDDRNDTPSTRLLDGLGVWDRSYSTLAWRSLVGAAAGGPDGTVPPLAAPARATDLAGLPPAYIDVGGLDVLLDEDMIFARRLIEAGVPTEFHLYPGAYHGFDAIVPQAAVSKKAVYNRLEALRRALRL